MDGPLGPGGSTESSLIGGEETVACNSIEKTDASPFANNVKLLTNSSGVGMLHAGVVLLRKSA